MKKLFSKKSGFTLVEIVIAFAIFAIMAAVIMGMLHLTINRSMQNREFEEDMQKQGQDLVAMNHNTNYDETADPDGTIVLQFTDKDGNKMPMNLEYQLRAANGDKDAAGVNYFVGNMEYDGENGEVEYIPGEGGDGEDPDAEELGGSSQMSRFDTRITGTAGISSIKLSYTYDEATKVYTFHVWIDDSHVADTRKENAQITIFFGEDKANGTMATIKQVNGGTKQIETLKYVKKVGNNGVNLHCKSGGFKNQEITFTVEFNEELSSLGFGSNASGGDTYNQYGDYVNIFGAYDKKAKPAEDGDSE